MLRSAKINAALEHRSAPSPHGSETGPRRNGFEGKPPWILERKPGIYHMILLVPGIHCAGCIAKIEKALKSHPAVITARVNFSTKRVAIDWQAQNANALELISCIENLGFEAKPYSPEEAEDKHRDVIGNELLRALAVAGFASANIMLLSTSIWSGATDATRDLFHWISALIALPAVIYAGRPFFRSAWSVLKHAGLNMDVPISLAVLLAAGASLFETFNGSHNTYFDASVMLLFFLLIGRYLDHMMRERARSAVAHLISLTATAADVIDKDGSRTLLPVTELKPDMHIFVGAGQRIPVDGEILSGITDLDRSIVTGETAPETASKGTIVQAGVMNLTGPLEIRVIAAGEDTFLGQMVQLMESAEQGKANYVRLANEVARIYAPAVHLLAGITFLGWLWVTGGDWHSSLLIAVSVLIITCPCALGLAVPVVQIVASGVLFKNGVMVKDGAALEKLALIDTVLFDKTGTLTLGKPELVGKAAAMDNDLFVIAAALAHFSNHPLSKALADASSQLDTEAIEVTNITEYPGQGLEGFWRGQRVRLGSRPWCGLEDAADNENKDTGFLELCLKVESHDVVFYHFEDKVRPEASEVIEKLKHSNIDIEVLSGDRSAAVKHVTNELGITTYHARLKPGDKLAHISKLASDGHKTFMVGDGINDAPALAAGFTSMAPSSASDVGRTAADFVFLGDRLRPVSFTYTIAKATYRLVKQNFALAIFYNVIAVPIAILGYASPLVAAIAMSSSSLIVTSNALRLRLQHYQLDEQHVRNMKPQEKVPRPCSGKTEVVS